MKRYYFAAVTVDGNDRPIYRCSHRHATKSAAARCRREKQLQAKGDPASPWLRASVSDIEFRELFDDVVEVAP